MAGDLKIMVEIADASAKGNNCIICRKELSQPTRPPEAALAGGSETTGPSPKRLQEILFKREQTKSRIENLQIELRNAYIDLTDVRAAEIKFLQENPTGTVVPLRAAAKELRKRESLAIGEREKQIKVLRKELASSNTVFEGIQAKMAKAFRKYAALYLDEPCDVEFLNEERLPGRHGPQIKAPHAAFFPIVSGQTRPSSQTLSDAQRSFVDLAFRMAVLEVWHQQTGKTATMIIETPEGAVDIAYMGRVASMLRTFGNQGHTLIITTNLNNDIFLPEIMCAIPKPQRLSRILNLLNHGRPRKVQQTHMKQFNKILDAVSNHPFEL